MKRITVLLFMFILLANLSFSQQHSIISKPLRYRLLTNSFINDGQKGLHSTFIGQSRVIKYQNLSSRSMSYYSSKGKAGAYVVTGIAGALLITGGIMFFSGAYTETTSSGINFYPATATSFLGFFVMVPGVIMTPFGIRMMISEKKHKGGYSKKR